MVTKEKKLSIFEKYLTSWISGVTVTRAGVFKKISPEWTKEDRKGLFLCRLSNTFRMKYSVPTGLYAVGDPDESSNVFVTANYKLSFDILRRELTGLDAWVLVLDTKGINVWCAAGKGTFGTKEVITRIKTVKLDAVVEHRKIIIPQLGAAGVHAHLVKKETGFTVLYGPVQARDIKAYIEAGYNACKEMRTVQFPISERIILTPMEIIPALTKLPFFAAGLFILFGLAPKGILFEPALSQGWPFLIMGTASIFAGGFLTPVLLPFLPFRSFAIKGLITGGILAGLLCFLFNQSFQTNIFLLLLALLFFPAASSYMALNFTGATPITNISGVKKELKTAIPLYIAALVVAFILMVLYILKKWNVI
ncbi:MAG: mercury methylation corrinoid protein HgcA [Spirochaetota bacterium]